MAGNVIQIILEGVDRGATRLVQSAKVETAGLNATLAGLASNQAVMAGIATALTGIATAAIASAKALGDKVEQLENFALSANLSIEQSQVLERVMKNQGLSESSAALAAYTLNRAIQEQNPLLEALGITTKDTWEALLQLSDAYARSNDGQAKAAINAELLGARNKQMLSVMSDLRARVEDVKTEMAAWNGVMDESAQRQAKQADETLDKFNNRLEDIKKNLQEIGAMGFNAAIDNFKILSRPDLPMGEAMGLNAGTPSGLRLEPLGDRSTLSLAIKASKEIAEQRKLAADAAEREAKAQREIFEFAARNAIKAGTNLSDQLAAAELADITKRRGPRNRGGGLDPGGQIVGPFPVDPGTAVAIGKELQSIAEATARGIDYAFTNVFVNLTNKMQTFRSAMKTIWDGIVQEVLAALGRIVASKVFGAIFGFLAGAIGGPIGAFFGTVAGEIAGGTSARRAPDIGAAALGGGNTYVINALDIATAQQAMVSRRGSIFQATGRINELAAVA